LHTGQTEPAGLIAQSFKGLDPATIRSLGGDLLQVSQQEYWEVSERRLNIYFVPDPQREKLREFLDGLLEDGKD
jgi:hypothetical protein